MAGLADDAKAAGVTLCVETHDSWCDANHLVAAIERVAHPNVQINWDIMHPVRVAGAMSARGVASSRVAVRSPFRMVHSGASARLSVCAGAGRFAARLTKRRPMLKLPSKGLSP